MVVGFWCNYSCFQCNAGIPYNPEHKPKWELFVHEEPKKAPIEGIGTYCLILDSGYHLDLPQTLYVPSLSRNLVSVSKLDVNGFSFKIGKGCFSLFNKDDSFIGSGTLMDGLYRLKLDVDFSTSLMCVHQNIGIKRSMANENSAYLLHKRLGHMSKKGYKD